MTPRVSILIPSHRPELLPDAVESVYHQTAPDYQILINFCDEWWPTKINELARAAVGEFVLVLCDDDLLAPTYLEKALLAADAHGVDVVYTDYARLRENKLLGWKAEPWALESFQSPGSNPLCGATYLVRKTRWDHVGGMDAEQVFWDWALAYACFKTGATAVHIPEPLVVYREHEAGHIGPDHGDAMRRLHRAYPELRVA